MVKEGFRCAICQSAADCFGEHYVSCGGNGDHIHRPNSLRDALLAAACSVCCFVAPEAIATTDSWSQLSSCQPVAPLLEEWLMSSPGCDRHLSFTEADKFRKHLPLNVTHSLWQIKGNGLPTKMPGHWSHPLDDGAKR